MGQAPGCGPDASMIVISVPFKISKTTCRIIIPVAQYSRSQDTSQTNEHVPTSSSAADPCFRDPDDMSVTPALLLVN